MQPDVFCIDQDASVKTLYQELQANDITGAPVLDSNDFLVGVVSLTDVARCLADNVDQPASCYYQSGRSQALTFDSSNIKEGVKVREIMSPRIHQVHNDSTIEETLDLMLDEDIHRAVVTHRGHVIGIVTSGDMMRFLRKKLRAERT